MKKCEFCGAASDGNESPRCQAPMPPPRAALVITKWWHALLLFILLVALGKALTSSPAHAEQAGPSELARITKALEQIPGKLDKLAEACRK